MWRRAPVRALQRQRSTLQRIHASVRPGSIWRVTSASRPPRSVSRPRTARCLVRTISIARKILRHACGAQRDALPTRNAMPAWLMAGLPGLRPHRPRPGEPPGPRSSAGREWCRTPPGRPAFVCQHCNGWFQLPARGVRMPVAKHRSDQGRAQPFHATNARHAGCSTAPTR